MRWPFTIGTWVAVSLAVLCAGIPPARSTDSKEGWGIQFRQDTFDKTLIPLGSVTEDTTGVKFNSASLLIACALDGSLVAAYNPSGINVFNEAETVLFRGAAGNEELHFSAVTVPYLGNVLGLDVRDSASLMALFNNADVAVPFRSEDKQGVFTSIGASETFAIIKAHCPK